MQSLQNNTRIFKYSHHNGNIWQKSHIKTTTMTSNWRYGFSWLVVYINHKRELLAMTLNSALFKWSDSTVQASVRPCKKHSVTDSVIGSRYQIWRFHGELERFYFIDRWVFWHKSGWFESTLTTATRRHAFSLQTQETSATLKSHKRLDCMK